MVIVCHLRATAECAAVPGMAGMGAGNPWLGAHLIWARRACMGPRATQDPRHRLGEGAAGGANKGCPMGQTRIGRLRGVPAGTPIVVLSISTLQETNK